VANNWRKIKYSPLDTGLHWRKTAVGKTMAAREKGVSNEVLTRVKVI